MTIDTPATLTDADHAELDALVTCYGSLDAIVTLQPDEQALRDAVLPWCGFNRPPDGTPWIVAIDGAERFADISDRTRDALEAALPMPATIPEALDEHQRWQVRDRECRLAFEAPDRCQLDLPTVFRWNLVQDLLEFALPARSIADVVVRQRYLAGLKSRCVAGERAVLADLERLEVQELGRLTEPDAASLSRFPPKRAESPRPAATGLTTASDRREIVRALLSKLDTVRLTDREIARRVGVSPQTVGNIRRRVAGSPRACGGSIR